MLQIFYFIFRIYILCIYVCLYAERGDNETNRQKLCELIRTAESYKNCKHNMAALDER